MPVTLEINYFNSYFLKKLQNVPSNDIEVVGDTWSGPSSNPNEDWYIEESRIRGGRSEERRVGKGCRAR